MAFSESLLKTDVANPITRSSMATRAVISSARRNNPIGISLLRSPLVPPSALSFRRRALPQRPTREPGIRIRRPGSSLRDSTGEPSEDLDDGFFEGDGGSMMEDESDDEEDAESSVDLLIRFLQSMFKKVARRAKRASRSVLPEAIPPQLVSFAVEGILLLASLSILKAFLEVACTLGGSVFVVILFLRVIWAAVSYFQSNGGGLNQDGNTFGAARPI